MAKKKEGGGKGAGRWAAVGITPVTQAWKSVNSADEHLIFLLDTANGDIHVCGDVSGVRAGLGSSSAAAALVTPPRSGMKGKPTAKRKGNA